MSLKKIVTLSISMLSVLGLSGCAQHMNYKSDTIIDSTENYKFNITLDQQINSFSSDNRITLYINNEIALKGKLDTYQNGALQGLYDGKELTLECQKDIFFKPTSCLIHLNKKRIGKLQLKM